MPSCGACQNRMIEHDAKEEHNQYTSAYTVEKITTTVCTFAKDDGINESGERGGGGAVTGTG